MKFKFTFTVVCVISLAPLSNLRGENKLQKENIANDIVEAYSQRKFSAPPNNEVEMVFCYDFFVPGKTSMIKFITAVPKTMPGRQKIQEIEYFPKPLREFSSKSGNKYAEFIFTEPKRHFDVEVHVKAELFRYDLFTAQKKYKKRFLPEYDDEDFLQDESSIEWDDFRIRKIAGTIKDQGEIETVKSIYDYVIDNMEYRIYHGSEAGASYAARQKNGDCSEYSDLFVALCRAKRIPARVITGYTVVVSDDLPKHAWTEVYLKKYGWVPFDPTWGDSEDPWLRKVKFHTMRPVYIYIKYPDKDEVIDNSMDFAILLRGDRKIEVEESLKFKKWKWQRPPLKEKIVTTKPKTTHGVVGGILYSKDNPLAVIDSKILKEGDTIHGVKIVKIYEDKVELEKNSHRWTQKAGETANELWQ